MAKKEETTFIEHIEEPSEIGTFRIRYDEKLDRPSAEVLVKIVNDKTCYWDKFISLSAHQGLIRELEDFKDMIYNHKRINIYRERGVKIIKIID